MRKAAPKVTVTEEMKETQTQLMAFMKRNPEIRSRRLYPHGFEVDISTIPNDKSAEFLSIVNKNNEN